jgi:hypothetical protein
VCSMARIQAPPAPSWPGSPRPSTSCLANKGQGCPASQTSLRSLRKLDCVPGMTAESAAPRGFYRHDCRSQEISRVCARVYASGRCRAVTRTARTTARACTRMDASRAARATTLPGRARGVARAATATRCIAQPLRRRYCSPYATVDNSETSARRESSRVCCTTIGTSDSNSDE